MDALLTAVGDVFTAVIGWAGTVGTTVVNTPVLLLMCVGVPLCGLGVGFFTRLLHTRG
ncbi:MAG: hypothetical protein HFF06_05430 [Oscillospiraceae bacterium]|jgi:hypothetical protein|nr:hypothetical protein [Oscillospiraceae bacterium]